jgi:putative ABC transport system permease protein
MTTLFQVSLSEAILDGNGVAIRFDGVAARGTWIYGTISYLVSERTHEIGIRLALGATRGTILQMILRQGLALAVAGAALGLVGALIVSHLMAGLLFGVSPNDPLTFVGVTLVLTGVALAASYIPAMRAMRVDPLVALRYE